MEKSIDLAIADFKEDLYNLINNSNLPIAIISMVINEIQQAVNYTYVKKISKEKEENGTKK